MYRCMCACVHTRQTHIRVHTHTHIHRHTYRHTHTHSSICQPTQSPSMCPANAPFRKAAVPEVNEAYRSLHSQPVGTSRGQIKSLVFPTHVLWHSIQSTRTGERESGQVRPLQGVSPTATIRKAISVLQSSFYTSPGGGALP